MLDRLKPWSPTTKVTNKITIDDLEIHFKRTIRIPDNYASNELPPDGGNIRPYKVDDYAKKLALSMAQKGWLFFPINRRSKFPRVKISVGGINAISGEPTIPNAATSLRTRNLIKQGKSVQDYVVTGPEVSDSEGQRWLDGIAVAPGRIRQFVVMPVGSGHSIEVQMTGQETTAGFQFEVTRLDRKEPHSNDENLITIEVMNYINDQIVKFSASAEASIEEMTHRIAVHFGISMKEHRILLDGTHLDYGTLASNGVTDGSILKVLPECQGGGGSPPDPDPEMNISAGGIIRQGIVQVPRCAYEKIVPVTFNVQVLNSVCFQHVTGKPPPRSPITAKSYADAGFPFFSMYEEPTTISGDFQGIKSIAQIDKVNEETMPVDMPIVKIGAVGVLNPHGSEGLELDWEVEERLGEMETLF